MDAAPLLEAARGLEPGIRLDLRFVPDAEMSDMLSAAHVIVFPYREIDVSGVLMAALRHGRPIIASRTAASPSCWLTDGTAFWCPPATRPRCPRRWRPSAAIRRRD